MRRELAEPYICPGEGGDADSATLTLYGRSDSPAHQLPAIVLSVRLHDEDGDDVGEIWLDLEDVRRAIRPALVDTLEDRRLHPT